MNEFKIKHGLIVSGSVDITGALNVLGPITIPNTVEVQDITVLGTASIAYLDVTFESASVIYSSGSNIFGDADNDVQTFNGDIVVNGTDFFVDASTSNVGIGTTAPGAKLDIVSTAAGSEGLRVDGASGGFAFVVKGGSDYTSHIRAGATIGVNYFTTPPSNGLIVEGNVGIGTTAPGQKLEVDGGIKATGALLSGGLLEFTGAWSASPYNGSAWVRPPSGVGVFLVNNAITKWAGFKPNDDFVVNSGNLLVQSSTGNVGIGTDSPSYKLSIVGSNPRTFIQDSSTGYPILQLNNASGNFYFAIDNSSGSGFGSAYARYIYSEGAYPMILVTNSAERMRIDSSGNVGIGTTSPGYKLQVNGDVGFFSASGSLNGIFTQGYEGKGRLYLYDGGNATIALQTNGVSYFNAGNVGIGTSSPFNNAKLQIRPATDVNIAFQPSNSLSNGGKINAFDDAANVNMNLEINGLNLGFKTNETERMRITSSGNVGIGTTAPPYALSVVRSQGDWIGQYKNYGPVAYGLQIDLSGSTGSTAGYVIGAYSQTGTGFFLTNAGNVGIGTTAPGSLYSEKLQISNSDIGRINITHTNVGSSRQSDILFTENSTLQGQIGTILGNVTYDDQFWIRGIANIPLTFLTNSAERMRITAGGNVGIGTTAVRNNGGLNTAMQLTGTDYPLFSINGSNSGIGVNTGVGSSGGYTGTYTAHPFSITTSDTVRMSVTASGNVGIGTTSPDEKLRVSGKIKADAVYVYDGLASGQTGIGASSSGGDLRLYSNGSIGAVLSAAGNVGIGTTSPSAKLQVDAGAGTPAFNNGIAINTGNGTYTSGHGGILQFQNEDVVTAAIRGVRESGWGSGMALYTHSTSSGNTFGTTVVERMRITEAGNVGIGTTSPPQKLSVDGNITATGYVNAGTGTDNAQIGPGYLSFYNAGSSPKYIKLSDDASTIDAIGFSKSGAVSTTWFPSGNVGIGTTAPAALLNVGATGTLHFTESGIGSMLLKGASGTARGMLEVHNGNSSSKVYLQAYTGGAGVGTLSNTRFDIATNSTTRMSITSAGNVGIGTTSPSTKLQVEGGSITVKGSQTQFSINPNYPGSGDIPAGTLLAIDDVVNNNLGIITSSSGTVGSRVVGVAYNGASWRSMYEYANVNTGEPNLILVKTAGNVGIGTTSPTQKLSLYTYSDTSTGVGTAINIMSDGPGGDIGYIGVNKGTGNGLIIGESQRDIIFQTGNSSPFNGTERLRITSSGNVGIGTTVPTAPLTVAGTTDLAWSASTSKLQISRSGTVARLQNYENGSVASLSLQWEGGNVGIGTTSPNSQLDAYTSQGGSKISTTHGTGGSYPKASGISFGATSTSLTVSNNGGTTAFTGGAGIYANNTASSDNPTELVFWTTSGGSPSERMRITSAGNVGIGTTVPAGQFEVFTSPYKRFLIDYPSIYQTRLNFGTAGYLAYDAGPATLSLFANDIYGTIALGAGGSERLRITSAGNVGIGTTSPKDTLAVNGTIAKETTTGFDGTFDNFIKYGYKNDLEGTGQNLDRWIGADATITAGGAAANKLKFKVYSGGSTGSPIDVMTLDGVGNVGIGTTSPDVKLHITTPATLSNNIEMLRITDGSYADFKILLNRVSSLATSISVVNTAAGNMSFETSNSERMRISSTGNVGIGTTSPGYKLDVSGIAAFGNGTGQLNAGSDGTSPYIEATGTNNLRFITAGADQMTITPAGDVGIGVPSPGPGNRLDVGGNVNVQGTLTALVKSFIIDHPTKEGKKLQYGVLEGPEHSVYVRGRLTNENTIVLPDHWYGLVHEDTITVNLTCIGRPQDLWVQEVNAYTITVGSEQENINCFYTVFAERKDVDKLLTEFDKA